MDPYITNSHDLGHNNHYTYDLGHFFFQVRYQAILFYSISPHPKTFYTQAKILFFLNNYKYISEYSYLEYYMVNGNTAN